MLSPDMGTSGAAAEAAFIARPRRGLVAPPAAIDVLGATTLALVVGLLDFLTGVELRLYPLYFLPVSWVAWRRGLALGLVLAFASTAIWEVANRLAGRTYEAPWVRYWNIGAQLSAFAVICLLMWRLHEEVRRERELRLRDPLTGVYNGRAFLDLAGAEIERARREGWSLALGFFDVDDFKAVNDRYGHGAGDAVLSALAGALQGQTRRTDLVARLGGDEFAVLWSGADATAAGRAAEACRRAVATAAAERGMAVTLSMGVAVFESAPADLESALRRADEAMYRRKRAGKDGYTLEVVPRS